MTSTDSIPSIFHPHLTQFSPHTHSLKYLHKELELEWVIALAESSPSITLLSNELILCARVVLHHLHLLQISSDVAGSPKVELLENYANGDFVNLYRNCGLCGNLANLAYLLSEACGKHGTHEEVLAELRKLLYILFEDAAHPFNTIGTETGEHTSRMLCSSQCSEGYCTEYSSYKTMYFNPLRCAFLEFLAIQPLTLPPTLCN